MPEQIDAPSSSTTARGLHRPTPILRHSARPVDDKTAPDRAAARLIDGDLLLVSGAYATGQAILDGLSVLLRSPGPDASYQDRRAFRHTWRKVSQRLLVPIREHRVALVDAPMNGFLSQLYPEHAVFTLPFEDVDALATAWSWYKKGVHLSVLGYRVHPFYGTYAPTRVSHLELFGTWLSQYKGPRGFAVDVGTGCGVLALMLNKVGFERVLATDTNANAIESVTRELGRLSGPPAVEPYCGDLLGEGDVRVDLVVFNPPWMQGEVGGVLESALYFEDGLFERFFEQASARLTASGRVVLVFSNLIRLVQPDVRHPIEAELERGRFKLVQKLSRKVKSSSTDVRGRRRSTRERVEVWELARA